MATATKQMNVSAGTATATVNTTVTDGLPAIPCPDPAGYRYVGARYVPKFADPIDWNSATSYEPLTIVLHEGNSYTSKTYVPVGVDIDNDDYWAITGNYNAQIEQYRQEVAHLSDVASSILYTSKDALTQENIDAYDIIVIDTPQSITEQLTFTNKQVHIYSTVSIPSGTLMLMFDGCTVDGGGTLVGSNSGTQSCMQIVNTHVSNLKFINFTNKAIEIRSNSIVDTCTVTCDVLSATNAGFSMGESTINSLVQNCTFKNTRIGVTMNSATGCTVQYCIFDGFTYNAVSFDGTVSSSGDGAHECKCLFNIMSSSAEYDGTVWPVAIYCGNGAHNNMIMGNMISGVTGGALRDYSDDNMWLNNRIDNCATANFTAAIQVRGDRAVFDGNIIQGQTYRAIALTSGTTGTILLNTLITATGVTALAINPDAADCTINGFTVTGEFTTDIDLSNNATFIFQNIDVDLTKVKYTSFGAYQTLVKNIPPIIRVFNVETDETTGKVQINPNLPDGLEPNFVVPISTEFGKYCTFGSVSATNVTITTRQLTTDTPVKGTAQIVVGYTYVTRTL